MKKTLLFLLISISSVSLSAQWISLPLNSSADLKRSSFPSNDTGYVTSGKIYRTFNGGTSFDSVSVPSITNYQSINFRTTTDGVICGTTSSGYGIYRTLNAGTSWQNITATNALGSPVDVKFADILHGTFLSSAPGLYNTANGGLTWDTLTFGYDYFNAIDYPTTSTGYIGGFDGTFNYKGVIAKTTNGGVTWSVVHSFTQINTDITELHFLNADTGFASTFFPSSPAHIARTRDGGMTWDSIHFNSGAIVRFAFRDYMNGFIVNDSGSIYRTTNAGITWTLDRAHTTILLYDINVTPLYAYSIGDLGLIIKRTNPAGIPVEQYDAGLTIYPNPGVDFVHLTLPYGTAVVSVSAIDVTGKNCGIISFSQNNPGELNLDVHGLSKGNYILEISGKEKTFHAKFEKAN